MKAKRNSILFTWGIIFTILNLWLWNPQLPLANYAINNNKMMLIQVVHMILNIGMTFMLLKLGQLFAKAKPSLVNLINSWILVIILGLLEVLIQLLWKNQFRFSDLLNSLFPFSRNVIPVVMGIILSRCLVPFYTNLKLSSRHQIGALLLAGLFASTIFNVNLWGFDNSYNLALTMIVVSVGALLSDLKLQLNQRMLKISVGGVFLLNLLLAAVMPKISVSVHNDFSTAARFANPSNVLTIIVALGLCYIFTKQLNFRMADTMLISITFASYPVLMNLVVSSIVGHFTHAALRYGVMLIYAILLLPISYCGLRLLNLISKTKWYDRYHKTVASFRTFTDIKTFLLSSGDCFAISHG